MNKNFLPTRKRDEGGYLGSPQEINLQTKNLSNRHEQIQAALDMMLDRNFGPMPRPEYGPDAADPAKRKPGNQRSKERLHTGISPSARLGQDATASSVKIHYTV